MRMFIKILNKKILEHPILEDNMRSAYSHVDLNNLPEDWAEFVRVPCPRQGVYEVVQCHYEWDGDVVKDVWYTHPMGPEEKAQKQNRVKLNYLADGGYANWIFNEDTCTHEPPIPYPSDGGEYIWIQQAELWVPLKKQIPLADIQPIPYPTDGNVYEFDLASNCWIPKL